MYRPWKHPRDLKLVYVLYIFLIAVELLMATLGFPEGWLNIGAAVWLVGLWWWLMRIGERRLLDKEWRQQHPYPPTEEEDVVERFLHQLDEDGMPPWWENNHGGSEGA